MVQHSMEKRIKQERKSTGQVQLAGWPAAVQVRLLMMGVLFQLIPVSWPAAL